MDRRVFGRASSRLGYNVSAHTCQACGVVTAETWCPWALCLTSLEARILRKVDGVSGHVPIFGEEIACDALVALELTSRTSSGVYQILPAGLHWLAAHPIGGAT